MHEFRWQDTVNANNSEVTAAPRLPRPRFNLMSVMAPFIGILAIIVFVGLSGAGGHWYWGWRGAWAAFILGASCLAGLVAGLIAVARKEALWGLTVVGLLLNAPVVMAFLLGGVNALIGWLQYG